MSDFRIPTRVRIAPGCSDGLSEVVEDLGAERILFVTDKGLAESPLVGNALAQLSENGHNCELFGEVESNPRTTTAEHLGKLAREGDVIVGFGGGSVIDAAKAAAMLATNGGSTRDWLGTRVFERDPLAFVAVPTTCGTGSEVTWVAVLTDRERGVKISVKGTQMFPDVALVDPDLIAGLPPDLIATTGLDALTHALEATTGSARNPVSDAMAEKSIALTLRYLARAVRDGSADGEARAGVMRAATLAGLAFGNSDVAGVHCLSETLGGLYDVAHGLANGLLLVPVMRSHGHHVEERLGELDALCQPTGGPGTGGDALAFLERIEGLVAELELPDNSALRIAPDDRPRIAALAAENGSNPSNPRPMGAAEYLAILESL